MASRPSSSSRLLEPLAPEDPALDAGLHQAVGEHAGGRAGHQRHGGLPQAGAQADPDGRRGADCDGLVRLRTDHDRRGVPGRRVRERARLRVVHRQEDGCEVPTEVLVDHPASHLKRDTRLEAGLQIRAQRVAHERGAGQGAAAVAGHVAEDEADTAAAERQHVVEVSAGARTVSRAVGDRGAQRADPLRHGRQQGALQQPDLGEQLAALARQRAVANRGKQIAEAEQDGERAQRGERDLEPVRDHLDRIGEDTRDERLGRRLGYVRARGAAPALRRGAAVRASLGAADLLEAARAGRRGGVVGQWPTARGPRRRCSSPSRSWGSGL